MSHKSGLSGEQLIKYKQYIRNAYVRRELGIPFTLTPKQFISMWKSKCVYCGEQIETIGIDRIDSDKGYEYDNVVPCCNTCNKMKMALDQADFIKKCGDIYFNFNLRDNEIWRIKMIDI